ncbi:ATP-citrate synthase [Smittium mucronatum]|uniref:ATP citrate synthase n=1 Tax=Smittium mucronatum TaxID=133383 RepID=A0A1R0H873_9FUNG|nr:ATP-citrate synthase [Smittium mucronatum]
MSTKAIREYDGKLLLSYHLFNTPTTLASPEQLEALQGRISLAPTRLAQIRFDKIENTSPDNLSREIQNQFEIAEAQNPWLLTTQLVAKPDQLIKRRGKSGLLVINKSWEEIKAWITERAFSKVKIGNTTGILRVFLVEPFLPHREDEEFYICIHSLRDGDEILFTHEGGVEVGDVDSKASKYLVKIDQGFPEQSVLDSDLFSSVSSAKKRDSMYSFLERLYSLFVNLNFSYLEINPLVLLEAQDGTVQVSPLDMAAKLDQTAEFESGSLWTAPLLQLNKLHHPASPVDYSLSIEFPAPFGRDLTKEEAYIADLDSKTGASLKLTILNKDGRIWTMVAGGGASVVYADAIAAYGFANELANYGEYSGAPSETQSYDYAKTILELMCQKKHPDGKILIIGGGIANFTNVASTFKGIIRALTEYKNDLIHNNVHIFVRRAGPNWQEGLRMMRELGQTLGVEIRVFGPETHITAVVPLALGQTSAHIKDFHDRLKRQIPDTSVSETPAEAFDSSINSPNPASSKDSVYVQTNAGKDLFVKPETEIEKWYSPFTANTRSIVFGMQPRAVQGMLDFDYICKRKVPSVACIVYPFSGNHVQKFYWGTQETLLPVFSSLSEANARFPEVSVVVNFSSCRSVYESTMEMMAYPNIRTIAIIAEGVPERRARQIIAAAKKTNVLIIGPATVGGIKPGCFKIGNTGGMMDNIVASKLYHPGSVAYVSKSGGMSNEINNIVSRTTDGVYEGVAIGGDRYPGSTFLDHLLRYQADPNVKLMVLLGEVGGTEEYRVVEAVKSGRITKPIVAWCIGTCAKMFDTEVQFGHAGALANSDLETADAKNTALRSAGVLVPGTFEELPALLNLTFSNMVQQGLIVPTPEVEAPKIPIDYAWAQELGLIRKPASFVSTICDDRGQELLYAGMRISDVFKEDIGIGGVLSLLWFKRRLPDYACKFIEMILMLTADHGPAVSGAHNTIVTARAGKDLVSSLCSGLLTIGDRFGGALDGAAEQFSGAYDKGYTPRQFVDNMRKKNKLILGIGHKIKSRTNPDLRVTIITEYARQHFPQTPTLDYAIAVENITTSKKDNLILNVDGAIGTLFVDLLRYSGAFTADEAQEYARIGTLNGLFVLGRSIGFIGHYLDQRRLKQGLYRHPWDDISYLNPTTFTGMNGSTNDRIQVGASKISKLSG